MYDGRTKLSSEVAREVRAHFGDDVYATVIPRSVRVSEAPSFGQPVLTLDASSRGAMAYRFLAAEFAARHGLGAGSSAIPGQGNGDGAPGRAREVWAHGGAGAPRPGGRGYGTIAPEPPEIDAAWPRGEPWTGGL
jgi:hypothetical protein